MSDFVSSRSLQISLVVIGALILLLASFQLGAYVGGLRAHDEDRWCESQEHMFGMPPNGPGPALMPSGQGVFGNVVNASGTTITVEGSDNLEHDVTISSSTAIREGRSTETLSDIKPGAHVGIFGPTKDDGSIDARLIRIMPQ